MAILPIRMNTLIILPTVSDGGKNWDLSSNPVTKGAFYGADLLKVEESFWSFVCGPNGIDYSEDLGKSWVNLDTANYWAVDFAQNNTGWAVGKGW